MTKKIAIMGSGNGSNFEAIVKYLNDVEITCISDIEGSKILDRARGLGVKSLYLPYENNENYFEENKFDLIVLAGYMRILTPKTIEKSEFINIHPSLLPAFKGKDAILQAFQFGAKVSGVSIHYVSEKVDEGRIIAQYPIFIDYDMNYNDLENEIHTLEHKLYPLVIKNLLENKVFSYFDLMRSMKGCKGCH